MPNNKVVNPSIQAPVQVPLNMQGQQVFNVAPPTDDDDVVTLSYFNANRGGGGTGTSLPDLERARNLVDQGWSTRTTSRNSRGLSTGATIVTPEGSITVVIDRDARGLVITRTYSGAPITNIFGSNSVLEYRVLSRDTRGLTEDDIWQSVLTRILNLSLTDNGQLFEFQDSNNEVVLTDNGQVINFANDVVVTDNGVIVEFT